MPTAVPNKKKKIAKLSGCIYYILLGLINLIGTAYSGHLGWKDFILLALCCTPLLVNRKVYYLLFGWLGTLFWGYMLYAVFNFHVLYVRGMSEHTNPNLSAGASYALGYAITTISIFFSLCVIYAGLSDSPQRVTETTNDNNTH